MSCSKDFDSYFLANPLKEAIKKGEISEGVVDEKVRNILRLMYRLKMIGKDRDERQAGTYNSLQSHEEVRNVAQEAVVLLKNEKQRLPLKKKGLRKLAVIGDNAIALHSNGGGSAEIKALYEISPLMGIKKLLGGNTDVAFARGYYVPQPDPTNDFIWQENSMLAEGEISHVIGEANLPKFCEITEEQRRDISLKLRREAVELAASTNEVILVCGLNHYCDVEGADRSDMKLPYEQEQLIEEVLAVNPNTVIAVVSGSPIDYSTFVSKAKAIVWMPYAGNEGGTALAQVLFGDVNPSGKLPETIGKRLEDYPAQQNGQFATVETVTYREGVFVGYRYFDSNQITPQFAFGHGLSYTTFEYSDLQVDYEKDNSAKISLKLKNTGNMAGKEVVQVYVAPHNSKVERPVHELKAFQKVFLEVGEEKEISLVLTKRDFSYYDVEKKSFVLDDCDFTIEVGSSSQDIRLKTDK